MAISIIWKTCRAGVAGYCGVYPGSSWSILPFAGGTESTGGIAAFAVISTLYHTSGEQKTSETVWYFLTILMIFGFQSLLTMGLHCTELLVNLSRDEDIWRRSYSSSGLKSRNAISTAARSWKTVLLFVLKPVAHWLFGLSMSFYIIFGLIMRPPQILYLSVSLILLALFGTYLCLSKPKGPQPATYGHLQTLVDLNDEWHEHLFWGHKSIDLDGVCHAGTSDVELEKIEMDKKYA